MSVPGCSVLPTNQLAAGGHMSDELWAHSANEHGVRHGLGDHLLGTAERAREFGDAFGAGELAGYLGLTHDVGKAAAEWQRGLLAVEGIVGKAVGIEHKRAGTWLAEQAAGPLAMCVYGHHGGLPSMAGLRNELMAAPGQVRDWTAAVAAALGPRGLYRFAAPTGSGKTIAARPPPGGDAEASPARGIGDRAR